MDSRIAMVARNLFPVPAAFHFGLSVAYSEVRQLLKTTEGFAALTVRSHRNVVPDLAFYWIRKVLAELPDCRVLIEAGAQVLEYRGVKCQLHKINSNNEISHNGTNRVCEQLGQTYLWCQGEGQADVPVVTLGYEPDDFAHRAKRIIVGFAGEGGMFEWQPVKPELDVLASIGPHAKDVVRRLAPGA